MEHETDVTEQLAADLRTSYGLSREFLRLTPMEKLSKAGARVLEMCDGLKLGYVSKAPVYDEAVRDGLTLTERKVLVRLVLGGLIRVIRVCGPLPGEHRAGRIGARAEFHYVLRADWRP